MTSGSRWTLPNIITVARIGACPGIFLLALATSTPARIAAFVLFIAAALSDIWDGYLARKHGLVTDLGKLLDPLADKLLLVATFVPFYLISHRPGELDDVPFWGPLPLWVMVVIFGRELAITIFRSWAQRRGTIIAAGTSGKWKTLFQGMFIGALLAWYPLQQLALARGWSGPLWEGWSLLNRVVAGSSLLIAVLLTVYSAFDYLWSYRALVRSGRGTD